MTKDIIINGHPRTIDTDLPIDYTMWDQANSDGFLSDDDYKAIMEAYNYTEATEEELMNLLLSSPGFSFSRQSVGWYVQEKAT